jgi:hypothetical protein
VNRHLLDVRIAGMGRTTTDLEEITTEADRVVWRSAATVLHERSYRSGGGTVRVMIDWTPLTERGTDDSVRLALEVIDEREGLALGDLPAFVELFFHEAFLLLNLAVPGSFGGVIAASGGACRINVMTLDARIFEYAWVSTVRTGWPRVELLPLAEVIAWYDALELGTQQLATSDLAKVLFHLLHLARGEAGTPMSLLRLGHALEALFDERQAALPSRIESLLGRWPNLYVALLQFFDARQAIADGSAPVVHPMHDDALDPRLDDPSLEGIDHADLVAGIVVSGLQGRIRGR